MTSIGLDRPEKSSSAESIHDRFKANDTTRAKNKHRTCQTVNKSNGSFEYKRNSTIKKSSHLKITPKQYQDHMLMKLMQQQHNMKYVNNSK